MHVHLTFAGKEYTPALNTINAIPDAIDRVVIMYSKTDEGEYEKTADILYQLLEDSGRACEKKAIKPFDFLNISDTMFDVYERYKEQDPKTKFSVGITNGTNLMAAAACSTAFFTNASVYYIMNASLFPEKSLEELLVPIQNPKIPDVQRLGNISKEILKHIAENQDAGKEVTNTSLATIMGMKPQALVYHVRRLEDAGLITIEKGYTSKGKIDNRKKLIKIKREGRFVLRWV